MIYPRIDARAKGFEESLLRWLLISFLTRSSLLRLLFSIASLDSSASFLPNRCLPSYNFSSSSERLDLFAIPPSKSFDLGAGSNSSLPPSLSLSPPHPPSSLSDYRFLSPKSSDNIYISFSLICMILYLFLFTPPTFWFVILQSCVVILWTGWLWWISQASDCLLQTKLDYPEVISNYKKLKFWIFFYFCCVVFNYL